MPHYADEFPISVWNRDLPNLIPKALMDRAFTTNPHADGREYAWLRDDALAVMAILEAQGCFILGVDTWIPRPDIGPHKLTPLGYDWDPEVWMRDSRYPKSSSDFVRTFEPDPSKPDSGEKFPASPEPWFNLTVLKRTD